MPKKGKKTKKAMIRLNFPSMEVLPSFKKALSEGFSTIYGNIDLIDKDPSGFLHSINDCSGTVEFPNGMKADKVPQDAMWISDGAEFIGTVALRHHLNNNLKLDGGHVGYEIRKHHQGKGIASFALSEIKKRAKEHYGIRNLLLTCSPDNTASQKVIIKNGGVYQDTVDNPFGLGVRMRYWINLNEN